MEKGSIAPNVAVDGENVLMTSENLLMDAAIENLNVDKNTKGNTRKSPKELDFAVDKS